MIKNKFFKYLNIAFSGTVFLCLAVAIIVKSFSSDKLVSGVLENVSCVEDSYRKGTFSYSLSIQNQGTFGNRLNTSCDTISALKIGEEVEVETSGHLLMQLASNGKVFIEREMVERREAKVNFMIYLIFFVALGDFLYRSYALYTERSAKANSHNR